MLLRDGRMLIVLFSRGEAEVTAAVNRRASMFNSVHEVIQSLCSAIDRHRLLGATN
jgi:hypothetical protein